MSRPPESRQPMDVVVDASVAVKWFVPEAHHTEALHLLDEGFRRHVPELLFAEVAQTLWKKVVQRGELTPEEGRAILRALLTSPLVVHPTSALWEPAFDIAIATKRTVYDSLYLALGAALRCRVVTADRKFSNALQGGPFAQSILWVGDSV